MIRHDHAGAGPTAWEGSLEILEETGHDMVTAVRCCQDKKPFAQNLRGGRIGRGLGQFHAQEAAEATPSTCDCYSSTPIYNVPITFDDNVPGDLQSFSSQSQADCFAWQEFISLNWPVSGDDFGEPGDTSQVQWETTCPNR